MSKPSTAIYEKPHSFEGIEHDGRRYPAAIEFEQSPFTFARHPMGYERNESGDTLYALPGGGRATEKQIRGMA